MNEISWSELTPFPGTGEKERARFQISARAAVIEKNGQSVWRLEYQITAKDEAALSEILLPEGPALRMDGLWEHTCFEAFLSKGGGDGYYEWNASPSGAWNLYSFDRYREGMKPVRLLPPATLPGVTLKKDGGVLHLSCEIGLFGDLNQASGPQVFCVVFETSRGISYWATAHTSEKADFHTLECRQIKFERL